MELQVRNSFALRGIYSKFLILAVFLAAFCGLTPAITAAAQIVGGEFQTLDSIDGTAAGDEFGAAVAGVGDVDNDGFGDYIVGAPTADPGGLIDAGSAFVYSGATGLLIYQLDGASIGDQFGASVDGMGDLNNDGHADFIVGAPLADANGFSDSGTAFVYSGMDGAEMFHFDGLSAFDQFGYDVGNAGDVNLDGVNDIVIGVPYADPNATLDAGSAYVLDGSNQNLLFLVKGDKANDHLGKAVAGAGDVDADGFADVIVGAPQSDPGGRVDAGSALVVSGQTAQLIDKFQGPTAFDELGTDVDGLGDINGDGYGDLIVGVPFADPSAITDSGSAFVISGKDSTLLVQLTGNFQNDQIGTTVCRIDDMNFDGVSEMLIGAPNSSPNGFSSGSATLFSGVDAELLQRFDGEADFDDFGAAICSAGDINQDGSGDIIIGAPLADPSGQSTAGRIYLQSLNPYLFPDGLEMSSANGCLIHLDVQFPIDAADDEYYVLASASGKGPAAFPNNLLVPLTTDPLFYRTAGGNYPIFMLTPFGTLDSQGYASSVIDMAPNTISTALIGNKYYLAVACKPGYSQWRYSSIAITLTVVP